MRRRPLPAGPRAPPRRPRLPVMGLASAAADEREQRPARNPSSARSVFDAAAVDGQRRGGRGRRSPACDPSCSRIASLSRREQAVEHALGQPVLADQRIGQQRQSSGLAVAAGGGRGRESLVRRDVLDQAEQLGRERGLRQRHRDRRGRSAPAPRPRHRRPARRGRRRCERRRPGRRRCRPAARRRAGWRPRCRTLRRAAPAAPASRSATDRGRGRAGCVRSRATT